MRKSVSSFNYQFKGAKEKIIVYLNESGFSQDLLPKLRGNKVIMMDNASFHKKFDIIELITGKGCIVEFLASYSPDLNPIETKWAQAKSLRKKFNLF